MVVFYSEWPNGSYQFNFIKFLGNVICEADRAYWMVPLSVDDMWELEE